METSCAPRRAKIRTAVAEVRNTLACRSTDMALCVGVSAVYSDCLISGFREAQLAVVVLEDLALSAHFKETAPVSTQVSGDDEDLSSIVGPLNLRGLFFPLLCDVIQGC